MPEAEAAFLPIHVISMRQYMIRFSFFYAGEWYEIWGDEGEAHTEASQASRQEMRQLRMRLKKAFVKATDEEKQAFVAALTSTDKNDNWCDPCTPARLRETLGDFEALISRRGRRHRY